LEDEDRGIFMGRASLLEGSRVAENASVDGGGRLGRRRSRCFAARDVGGQRSLRALARRRAALRGYWSERPTLGGLAFGFPCERGTPWSPVALGPSDRDDVQHVVELTVLAAVEAVLVRWLEEHGIGAVPVCSPKLECLRNCLTPAVWPIRIAAVSAAALLGEQPGRCALTSSVSSAAS